MRTIQGFYCFFDFLTHLFAFKQLQQHFFSRMTQVSMKPVGNSSCMRSMRRSQLSQSASLGIINCIDLLSEILIMHDGHCQMLCQNNAIVFSFSASLTTTRHGTFKWTMGVITLTAAIHEPEHCQLRCLNTCGFPDWLLESIIIDCCGPIFALIKES